MIGFSHHECQGKVPPAPPKGSAGGLFLHLEKDFQTFCAVNEKSGAASLYWD